MFVRPGKHQYVVRSPDGEMIKCSFISGLRTEDIPGELLFNENLTHFVEEKKFFRETSIFADFKIDTKFMLD